MLQTVKRDLRSNKQEKQIQLSRLYWLY